MRVFITGASEGLGAALARHYARAQGSNVELGLVARRGDRLEALAASLPARCRLYPLDVTDPVALRQAAQDFMANAGLPNIVIANAGISVGALTEESDDLEVFNRVLQVNMLGMVHTFQPFVTPMREARRGQLVGISSVAGIRGIPGAGAYCASKSAAISYLESLRIELQECGIKVTTILPGYIATPMTANNPYPMPFLLDADEAARRIVRQIRRGVSYAVVPWQMAVVSKLLRSLPNPVFDRLFGRMFASGLRKPRQLRM